MTEIIKQFRLPIVLLVVGILSRFPDDGSRGWVRPFLWQEVFSVVLGVLFIWGLVELLKEDQ